MIPRPLIGALVGVMAVTAIALVIVGLTPTRRVASPRGRKVVVTGQVRRAILAGMVFVALSLVTGWLAVGAFAAAMIWFVPSVLATRRATTRDRERMRAIAQWIEIIRDSLRSAAGVDEAVIASAELVSHTAIADDVARLRIVTQTSGIKAGLQDFSDAMADPIADQAVWALLVATDRPSQVVGEVLSRAATNARSQVARRERIEATRARSQTIVNTVMATTVGVGLFMIGSQPSYREWYSSFTGQTFLCVGIVAQLTLYSWMTRMARHRATFRTPVTAAISTLSPGGVL